MKPSLTKKQRQEIAAAIAEGCSEGLPPVVVYDFYENVVAEEMARELTDSELRAEYFARYGEEYYG